MNRYPGSTNGGSAVAGLPATSAPVPDQVVILTAGQARRVWPLSRGTPKALLPIGGKPASLHMLLPLIRKGTRDVLFVISPGSQPIVDATLGRCLHGSGINLRYVEQAQPLGPGHAFSLCAGQITGSVLLVLADTLCDLPRQFDGDWIGVSRVYPGTSSQWCMVQTDAHGRVMDLIDKPAHAPGTDLAAVGVYFFRDPSVLRTAMTDSLSSGERVHGEYQLSSILRRYGAVCPFKAHEVGAWHDLGTLHGYAAGIRAMLPHREFNDLQVSPTGRLRKRSSSAHIAEEIDWYRHVPSMEAALLAPRLLHTGEMEYSTEYLDYPSLAEMFLFGGLPDDTWQFVFAEFLDQMRDSLWRHTRDVPDLQARVQAMVVTKTVQRLEQWGRQDLLRRDSYIVNGRQVSGFARLWQAAEPALSHLVAGSSHRAAFIHGDLSFGNILYSPRSSIFRLIDPRGNFGGPGSGPFGDVRYEAAKLRQCTHGLYDVIMSDLFHVEEVEPGCFNFVQYPAGLPDAGIFDRLLAKAGFDLDELEWIEAMLFLSMIPLHSEAPERQLAFFLTGLACMERQLLPVELSCSSSIPALGAAL